MALHNYILVAFCLFTPVIASEHAELCISTKLRDFLQVDIQQQSDPLQVSNVVVVTSSITKEKLANILFDAFPNISLEKIEPCFFIDCNNEVFKIISGNQEGDCDLFDSSGKAQKTWVLEAIHPGKNQRIGLSVGWKYFGTHEIHPICPSEERFISVDYSSCWFLHLLSDNWDKISITFISFASLIVSIIALIKKVKS